MTSLTAPGAVTWPLTDNLGTVRDIVNSAGAVIDHIVDNAFGQVAYETAPTVHHLEGYTGAIYDPDTGMINDLHRWYDPATGRWLSQDPKGFAAGDANLYRYVGNSVMNEVDPSGLAPHPDNHQLEQELAYWLRYLQSLINQLNGLITQNENLYRQQTRDVKELERYGYETSIEVEVTNREGDVEAKCKFDAKVGINVVVNLKRVLYLQREIRDIANRRAKNQKLYNDLIRQLEAALNKVKEIQHELGQGLLQ